MLPVQASLTMQKSGHFYALVYVHVHSSTDNLIASILFILLDILIKLTRLGFSVSNFFVRPSERDVVKWLSN